MFVDISSEFAGIADLVAKGELNARAHITECNLPCLFHSYYELSKKLGREKDQQWFKKDWAFSPFADYGIPNVSNFADMFKCYVRGVRTVSVPHITQFPGMMQALYSVTFLANFVFNVREGVYEDLKQVVLECAFITVENLISAANAVNLDINSDIPALGAKQAQELISQPIIYVQSNYSTIYSEFGLHMADTVAAEHARCFLYFLNFKDIP